MIPEPLQVHVLEGMAAGLTEQETLAAWRDYALWSEKAWPGRGLGGRSWTRQIQMAVERKALSTPLVQAQEDRAALQREKARRDRDYERQAMTLEEYRRRDPEGARALDRFMNGTGTEGGGNG